MPSNDAANYLTAADQMANFKWLQNVARLAGVVLDHRLQPRNFPVLLRHETIKDAILDNFGNRAIRL